MVVYLASILLLGVPIMLSEFVIGRHTRQNAKSAIDTLRPKRHHYDAFLLILCGIMFFSFYSVVGGWVLYFLYESVAGGLQGHSPEEYSELFSAFVGNPYTITGCTLLFILINFVILQRGITKGIEKISNILMPFLFLIIIIFCANSLMMPGAAKGLEFMFNPDFSVMSPEIVVAAMGQAFFSLSLGLGCVLTYASYFSQSTSLVKTATMTVVLDTLVAVLSGVMIFPALFSFGAEPTAGPKLVFEVLPNIFQQLPGAYFWAVAFFVLLFFACITSSISMAEIPTAFFTESFKIGRTKALAFTTIIGVAFGILCSLSFNVLADFKVFGKSFFDLFDFVTSSIFMPVGGLMFTILVGWLIDKRILEQELTNNGTLKVRSFKVLRFCIRYVAPAAILLIFFYSWGLI